MVSPDCRLSFSNVFALPDAFRLALQEWPERKRNKLYHMGVLRGRYIGGRACVSFVFDRSQPPPFLHSIGIK